MAMPRAVQWIALVLVVAGCPNASRSSPRASAASDDTGAANARAQAAPGHASGTRRSRRAKCLPHAEAWKRQGAIEQKNRAAFEAAVRKAGLRLVALDARHEQLYDGPHPPPPGTGSAQRPAWTEYTGDGGQRRLAGPVYHSNCPKDDGPDIPDFAQAPDGTVYRLEAQPRSAGTVTVSSCGCPVVDMSRMCGAYMPRVVQVTFTLPSDSRYGGVKKIAYPRRTVKMRHAHRLGTRACPMPQPPP